MFCDDHVLGELQVWLTVTLPPPVLPLHLKTLYMSSFCLQGKGFGVKEALAIHNSSETGALPPGLSRWETYSHWLRGGWSRLSATRLPPAEENSQLTFQPRHYTQSLSATWPLFVRPALRGREDRAAVRQQGESDTMTTEQSHSHWLQTGITPLMLVMVIMML